MQDGGLLLVLALACDDQDCASAACHGPISHHILTKLGP